MLRRLALTGTLAAMLLASPVRADDRATAQELFEQGKDLMQAGNTVEACAKFAGAADLSQTVGVRLNLATCYEKIGRTASAWTRYDEALTIAERLGDAAAAQLAKGKQEALKPHLSYLAVNVPREAAAVPQLAVQRDGQQVPQAAWGLPVPVDPGDHEVKASAPGYKTWTTSAKVTGEGVHADVQVPVLVVQVGAPVEIAPAGPTAVPAPGAASRRMGTQRIVGLAATGAGVLGMAIGGVFGLLAGSAWSEQRAACASPTACSDHAGALSDHSTLSTDATALTALFITGGVLLAGGVALFVSGHNEPGPPRAAASLVLAPSFGVGGAGMSLAGRF